MKRKYEVLRVDALEGGLNLRIEVHDGGACWFIDVGVPWNQLLRDDVWQMLQSACDKQRAWEARQRERLQDSLF